MKIQIRQGMFETNSSSTHSLIISTEDEFKKWVDGKVYLDRDSGIFVNEEQIIEWAKQCRWVDTDGKDNEAILEEVLNDEYRFYAYGDYGCDYEYFDQHFTSPSGDEMVAFGYFGYDG